MSEKRLKKIKESMSRKYKWSIQIMGKRNKKEKACGRIMPG